MRTRFPRRRQPAPDLSRRRAFQCRVHDTIQAGLEADREAERLARIGDTATEAFGGSLAPDGHREIATESNGLRCQCGRLYSSPRALMDHHEGVIRDAELDRARAVPS